MLDEWYEPREIRYTQRQFHWLMANLLDLKGGAWPPDPKVSGYVDAPIGKKGRKRHAYFEVACLIAAEVETRLERAGIDGLLLKAIYSWGESEEGLAKMIAISPEAVLRRAAKALRYVSGHYDNEKKKWFAGRREESYKKFKDNRRE